MQCKLRFIEPDRAKKRENRKELESRKDSEFSESCAHKKRRSEAIVASKEVDKDRQNGLRFSHLCSLHGRRKAACENAPKRFYSVLMKNKNDMVSKLMSDRPRVTGSTRVLLAILKYYIMS